LRLDTDAAANRIADDNGWVDRYRRFSAGYQAIGNSESQSLDQPPTA
jgi:hypothetical protein